MMETAQSRVYDVLEEACNFYQSKVDSRVKYWINERWGFDNDTIQKFRIGFAPRSSVGLIAHLWNKGFSIDEMIASSLVGQCEMDPEDPGDLLYPTMRGRIMVPYLVAGRVRYFIGRETEDTPRPKKDPTKDPIIGKYKKLHRSDYVNEPIFGIDSVVPNRPLIITEGIADCIDCIRVGYSCISPVTTHLKGEALDQFVDICKNASEVYVINDSEESDAGLNGAISIGLHLADRGVNVKLSIIPRPAGVEKVDLNDYIRSGGDVEELLHVAKPLMEHPLAIEKAEHRRKVSTTSKPKSSVRGSHSNARNLAKRINSDEDTPSREEWRMFYSDVVTLIKENVPLSRFVQGEGRMAHPIYGSITGSNLSITYEKGFGEWYCFHAGSQGGGDVLKWVAVYELDLIDEDDDLNGDNFKETVKFLADTYLPGTSFKQLKDEFRETCRSHRGSTSTVAQGSQREGMHDDIIATPEFLDALMGLIERHVSYQQLTGVQSPSDSKTAGDDIYTWVAIHELHLIAEGKSLTVPLLLETLKYMMNKYVDIPLHEFKEEYTRMIVTLPRNEPSNVGGLKW